VDPARAFDRKPLWARILVIVAGVTMNLILAYVIITGETVFVGVATIGSTVVDSVVAAQLPPGAEALAGLHRGDRLVSIGTHVIRDWGDVSNALDSAVRGSTVPIRVAGRAEPLIITISRDSLKDGGYIAALITPLIPARIGLVIPGLPAYKARLQQGDLIVGAAGDTVASWSVVQKMLHASPGRAVTLRVRRADSTFAVTLTPDSVTDAAAARGEPKTYGQVGIQVDIPMAYHPEPISRAIPDGWDASVRTAGGILGGLRDIVTGRVSLGQALSGPVTIAQVSGQVARQGVVRYLDFMALFSINLAFLNLLPIPVLDGGHLMFLIAEGIRRRPLSIELRLRLLQVGFFLIVGLMLFVVGNDVLRALR
jgi:regulator of sigma E protease